MRTVFLIVNESLQMSPGKLAAQTFQACQRLMEAAQHNPELAQAVAEWQAAGTRVRTKVAPTQHLFDRAAEELVPCHAVVMIDEGMTEVEPDTATVIATYPMLEGAGLPRMLQHKRIRDMQPCCQAMQLA